MKPGKPLSRRSSLRRKTRVKPKNVKRRTSEFARCYHSRERVQFVKTLKCVSCHEYGHSENAHIESGGAGRKADYTKVVPLCGPHDRQPGCHRTLHQYGHLSHVPPDALAWYAAYTESQFQAYLAGTPRRKT